MSNIGVSSGIEPEVGVATEYGRAYYRITSLLNNSVIPFADVLLHEYSQIESIKHSSCVNGDATRKLKLIITTRREKLLVSAKEIICIEDLGDDYWLAKQRLLSILHPLKETDTFVVGIDPGERTGIAAFLNQIEVDSAVLASAEDAIFRTRRLLDNAQRVKRIVRIGRGIPALAEKIASGLEEFYRNDQIRIQLVDEHGTSSLYARGKFAGRTRDQLSARLIAFREGRDYRRVSISEQESSLSK